MTEIFIYLNWDQGPGSLSSASEVIINNQKMPVIQITDEKIKFFLSSPEKIFEIFENIPQIENGECLKIYFDAHGLAHKSYGNVIANNSTNSDDTKTYYIQDTILPFLSEFLKQTHAFPENTILMEFFVCGAYDSGFAQNVQLALLGEDFIVDVIAYKGAYLKPSFQEKNPGVWSLRGITTGSKIGSASNKNPHSKILIKYNGELTEEVDLYEKEAGEETLNNIVAKNKDGISNRFLTILEGREFYLQTDELLNLYSDKIRSSSVEFVEEITLNKLVLLGQPSSGMSNFLLNRIATLILPRKNGHIVKIPLELQNIRGLNSQV